MSVSGNEFPSIVPKNVDHEKWQAMVDSVVDFISASRTMLGVLTERLKDHERAQDEERRRVEDEQIKLQFYRECLNMELSPQKASKSAQEPSEDTNQSGDQKDQNDKGLSNTEKMNDSILNKPSKYLTKNLKKKRYAEENSKDNRFHYPEANFNEGTNIGKPPSTRKYETYSKIHTKCKTSPKGDVAQI